MHFRKGRILALVTLFLILFVVWMGYKNGFLPQQAGEVFHAPERTKAVEPAAPPDNSHEMSPEEAAALEKEQEQIMKRHEQRIREILAAPSSDPPVSLQNNGKLTQSIVSDLSLTSGEANSLGKVIDGMLASERASLPGRTVILSEDSDVGEIPYGYFIKPGADKGRAGRAKLAAQVAKILDETRTKRFMEGVGEFDFYGGFGKYGIKLGYYSENGSPMVQIGYVDPATGRMGRRGKGPLDDQNWEIWKSLKLPEN